MSRPSRTAPPGRVAKSRCSVDRAPAALRELQRRSRPPRPCRGRATHFRRSRSAPGRARRRQRRHVSKILPVLHERAGRRPIEQAGIEMRQAEMLGQPARQSAFAGRRRTSIATIMKTAPRGFASEDWKVGKLVAIIAASSIAIGAWRGKPETQKTHRNAMIEMRRRKPPPGTSPSPPPTMRSSPSIDASTPAAEVHRRPPRGGRIPSPAIPTAHAFASRPKRTRPPRRESDIRRSSTAPAPPAHRRPAVRSRARADPRRARRPRRAGRGCRCARPFPAASSRSPVRSGFIIMPSMTMSEPGTISAATSGKAAEEGSAGTTTGVGLSSGRPSSVILRPSAPNGSLAIRRAKMRQHLLGMVAARLRLDHHWCGPAN